MDSGDTTYVSGYEYEAGMRIVVCHQLHWGSNSNSDSHAYLHAIQVGEKIAYSEDKPGWEDDYDGPGATQHELDWSPTVRETFKIQEEDLFGGESSEGGIYGRVNLYYGNWYQDRDDYEVNNYPVNISAYRGVFSVLLQNFVFAIMQPYLKAWKFLVHDCCSDWRQDLAEVHYRGDASQGFIGMNPVNIIWNMLTSNGGVDEYGAQFDTDDIDEDTFYTSAKTLYDEGFGLNMLLDSGTSTRDFIEDIMRYIDGVLFQDPFTGLIKLRLFRGGYDVADLASFDTSNIVKMNSFARAGHADLINQVAVKWTSIQVRNGDLEKEKVVYRNNLAERNIQDRVVSETIDFTGIAYKWLATVVADRELRQLSFPLAALEFEATRGALGVLPGDIIKVSWPDYDLSNMVCRVTQVEYGTLTDNKCIITAVEDIYGMDYLDLYADDEDEEMSDEEVAAAVACPHQRVIELPYYITVVGGVISESNIDNYDIDLGIAAFLGERPNGYTLGYDLYEYSDTYSKFVSKGGRTTTPTGTLLTAIDETSTLIYLDDESETNQKRVLTTAETHLALVEDELVIVTTPAVWNSDNTLQYCTISRGVLDTVPAAHAAGARVWFINLNAFGLANTEHYADETTRLKALTKTSSDRLDEDDATEISYTFDSRMARPYPPANVCINGDYFPDSVADETAITVSWDNRNRLTQTGYVVEQDEGNATPETGAAINVSLYDSDGETLIHAEEDLDATAQTWTYTLATEIAERSTAAGDAMICKVESVRDGYTSWQAWEIAIPARTVTVAGETYNIITEDGDALVTESGDNIVFQ